MLTPAACACKRTRRVLCVPGTTKGCCFCAQRSSTCTMKTDGNTLTRTTTCLTSDTVTPGVMSMPSIHSLRCPLRCACVHMWRVCDVSGLACTAIVSSVHLCAWRFVYVACGQPYALFVVCACACGLRHWVQAVSGLVRGRMLCDIIELSVVLIKCCQGWSWVGYDHCDACPETLIRSTHTHTCTHTHTHTLNTQPPPPPLGVRATLPSFTQGG
jgi:hypothetical protein